MVYYDHVISPAPQPGRVVLTFTESISPPQRQSWFVRILCGRQLLSAARDSCIFFFNIWTICQWQKHNNDIL